jgi:hypothetical protein
MIEPVAIALSLSKRLMEKALSAKAIPSAYDTLRILQELGMEEVCTGKGLAVYRSKDVVALLFPLEGLIVDLISASGDLSDAVELVAYHDKKLNAFIIETIPASDIKYEGNIGLEPVIIDSNTGELMSTPVLGDVIIEKDGPVLLIDGETYNKWKEVGKTDTCPICGGELRWKGKEAICIDCGYRIRVVEG